MLICEPSNDMLGCKVDQSRATFVCSLPWVTSKPPFLHDGSFFVETRASLIPFRMMLFGEIAAGVNSALLGTPLYDMNMLDSELAVSPGWKETL